MNIHQYEDMSPVELRLYKSLTHRFNTADDIHYKWMNKDDIPCYLYMVLTTLILIQIGFVMSYIYFQEKIDINTWWYWIKWCLCILV